MTSAVDRKLRVGVLLDDLSVPAWIARVLEELRESRIAEITAIIKNSAPRPRPGPVQRAWLRRNYFFYHLYDRVDRLIFSADPDPLRKIDARPLLQRFESLEVSPRRAGRSDAFPEEALHRVRELDLDVALQFGFRPLTGDVLTIPRYGVWSYCHDDSDEIHGGPPGFWEVFESQPVTSSELRILTERSDRAVVLCRSWSPTHRRSVNRNRAHTYWKSVDFVARELRKLHSQGRVVSMNPTVRLHSSRSDSEPTNLALAPKLARLTWRASSTKLLELVQRERWGLAWHVQSPDANGPPEFCRFREVGPPEGRFWADPFPERNGKGYLLFFEEYVNSMKKAIIRGLELDEEGRALGDPFPALERPYHLSYPFTFRYKGSLFMMPETLGNRTVEIYRCDDAPDSWTLEKVVLEDVRAVDATLHQHEDRWWMFVNMANNETSRMNDELHVYFSSSPLGPWEPLRRNPVVSDARSARPAGRLFSWRGNLMRPSQDCSNGYGSGLSFNRVLELSTHNYREELLSKSVPDWDRRLSGLHTYNRLDRLSVIDVRRRSSRLRWGGRKQRLPRAPRSTHST